MMWLLVIFTHREKGNPTNTEWYTTCEGNAKTATSNHSKPTFNSFRHLNREVCGTLTCTNTRPRNQDATEFYTHTHTRTNTVSNFIYVSQCKQEKYPLVVLFHIYQFTFGIPSGSLHLCNKVFERNRSFTSVPVSPPQFATKLVEKLRFSITFLEFSN